MKRRLRWFEIIILGIGIAVLTDVLSGVLPVAWRSYLWLLWLPLGVGIVVIVLVEWRVRQDTSNVPLPPSAGIPPTGHTTNKGIQVDDVKDVVLAVGRWARATVGRIVRLCIDVAVPDRTAVNATFDLAVLVRPPSLPALQEEQLDTMKTGEANVFWPKDQPYVSLRVKVRAPDCTILDADSRSFRLCARRASPILYFHLVPRKLGTIGIVVELYQEEDEIASARVQTMALEQLVGEVKVDIVAQAAAPQSGTSFRFAATTDVANEDIGFMRLLLRERQRRLEKLELQRAREGHATDPKILNEIEDLQDEIKELKRRLRVRIT